MPVTDPKHRQDLLDMGLDPDQYSYAASPQSPTTSPASPPPAGSSSAGGAFGRQAIHGLIPTLGAVAGAAGLASWLGGPLTGVPTNIALALAGGLGGGALASYGQEKALEHFAPGVAQQLAEDAAQHPVASTLGNVASALPTFELSPGKSISGLAKIPSLIRGTGTAAEKAAAYNAALQVGMGAASGVGAPLLEGRAPTLEDIGVGAGQALLFGDPRRWTSKVPILRGMHSTTEKPLAESPPSVEQGPRPGTDTERMSAAMGEAARDRRTFDIGRRENAGGLVPSLYPESSPLPPAGIGISRPTEVPRPSEPSPIGPHPELSDISTSTVGDVRVGGEEPRVFSQDLSEIGRMQKEVADLEVLPSNPALNAAQRIMATQELTEIKAKLASAGGLELQRAQATQGQAQLSRGSAELPVNPPPQKPPVPPPTHSDPSVAAELQRISESQTAPAQRKEPVLSAPAPTPTAAVGESGTIAPEATGVKPPAAATAAQKRPNAKPKGEQPLTGEEKPKVARGISGRTRLNAETERTGPDILDFLANKFQILSKTAARQAWGREKFEKNKSLWDDAPERMEAIHHNSIYGGKFGPDVAANAAFREGIIKDSTPTALWEAVKKASASRAGHGERVKVEAEFLEKQGAANDAWQKATGKGKVEVSAEDLKPGDFLEVEGERIRIMERDPTTGDLTLQDGTKFRTQTLAEGQTIHVEHFEPAGSESTEFQSPGLEARPLVELLADPKNRAVHELLMDLAARHRVTVEGAQGITTPEGDLAAGLAEWKKRVATLNVSKLNRDTLAHEVGGHIIFEDMLLSQDPAVRALAERGLLLMGSRERMAQALGTRMTDLAGLRVEGLTLKRFTTWVKDFVSYIKTKWGNANESDFANLLARRILNDGPYEPMPGVAANTPELQYQRLTTTDAATRAEVETMLKKADEVTDWTLPGVRATVDSVMARVGKAAGSALANAERWGNTFAGNFRHPLVAGIKSLNATERANVDRYVYSVKAGEGTPDPALPTLTPREQNFVENVLRPHMQKIADTVEASGKRIGEDGELRLIKRKPWWVPDVPRQDVLHAVGQNTKTPEAQALLHDMHAHMQEKLGLESIEAARDLYANKKIQQAMLAGGGATEYGPISRPAGIGLPRSWRAPLDEALPRYADRAGKALGFFKAFNESPEASYQLGVESQDGSAPARPANYTGDVFTDDSAVKVAMKVLKGDYDAIDQYINIINRGAKTLSLQTATGLADAITAPIQILPDMRPKDLPLLLKGFTNIVGGFKNAMRMGVAKDQSIALGELGTEGQHYTGISKVVQGFHKVADLINTITGRNGLELFSRGYTYNVGEALAWSKLGDAFSPTASKADRRAAVLFFREHAPSGWERTLGDAVQNGTWDNSPEVARIMDESAAHVVDNAQGTYGIRGLPGVALTGHLAPFLSLAKWNIEKFNTFNRTVIGAARRGNLTPLLTTAFGAIAGGSMVELMREWLTRRKPQDASWSEIIDAGGTGLPYKLAALAAWSGYGGIATEIGKQVTDLATGRPPQGFRFPAISFVDNVARRLSQASVAVDNGENALDVATQLAVQLSKDNIQMARAGLAWTEEGGADVKRANTLRDVSVFNRLSGQPLKSVGSAIETNPFLNAEQRKFGRSEDISQIVGMAPGLVKEAFDRGGGDISRVRSLLTSARNSGSDLLPSLEAQPQKFMQYLDFVRRTQGKGAASAAMQDYVRKQSLDTVRRGLIPRL